MIVYFCRPLLYNSNLKQDNKRQSHLLKVMERKWFSALHWKHRDDFICLSAPFFSRVWWQPQGWTRRSNPVSWLSSSIRAQPALHVDHRGAPWEHYQVRGTFFVSFLLALSFGITFFVFFLVCLLVCFVDFLSIRHLSIYFQITSCLQWYLSLSQAAV